MQYKLLWNFWRSFSSQSSILFLMTLLMWFNSSWRALSLWWALSLRLSLCMSVWSDVEAWSYNTSPPHTNRNTATERLTALQSNYKTKEYRRADQGKCRINTLIDSAVLFWKLLCFGHRQHEPLEAGLPGVDIHTKKHWRNFHILIKKYKIS